MGTLFSPIIASSASPVSSPRASSVNSRHSQRSLVAVNGDRPFTATTHMQPNEQLRTRELLRYYTPPSPTEEFPIPSRRATPSSADNAPSKLDPPSPLEHASNIENEITQPASIETLPIGGGSSALKSSDDPALTAFAQLLALKLDCQRSMISLIDRTKQYIVAEATRTLSITDSIHLSGLVVPDGLWLGCETIPKEGGLCVNTVQLYPETEYTDADEFTILEIPDLSLDPRFKDRDYVLNYPYLKFYAGTPLRTKRGYNIGSLCVVDSSPRVLTLEERKTLGRMGKLVMRHLELTAETRALKRNQRMAESLGRFVARRHGALDDEDEDDEKSDPFNQPNHVSASDGPRDDTGGLSSNGSSSVNSAGMLTEVFTRASVLIRDALMTDGVIFVDADKTYNPSPMVRDKKTVQKSHRRRSKVLGRSSDSIDWRGEHYDESDDESIAADDEPKSIQNGPGRVPSETTIKRLLELYPHGTILSFDEPVVAHGPPTSSSEAAREYPSPESTNSPLMTDEERVSQEVQEFLPDCTTVLFLPLFHAGGKPYAASFSWTRDERRVFTQDELSYMQGFMSSIMAEVSRLHTLSADKAKGDFISSISHELRSPLHGVLASAEFLAETTLDTFQKSFVDTVENCGRMLLDTINHVLDFSKLNSLMKDQRQIGDRARREEIGRDPKRSRRGSYGGVVSLIEATDLSLITEQVVESVYAGYEFKGISSPGITEPVVNPLDKLSLHHKDLGLLDNSSGHSVVANTSHNVTQSVAVILDIERRHDWTYVTQPGAVRRILMNIVGNALKYTDSGWVRVQLQAKDLPRNGEDDKHRSKITFIVSDSGRGIGRDFLKSRLFTPFSQEDTLASGTGLGMSIVRQIVQLLGGDIKVKSQVGVGTEVTVTLTLEQPSSLNLKAGRTTGAPNPFGLSAKGAEDLSIQRIREFTVGKTICLCGLDALPTSSLLDHGTLSRPQSTQSDTLVSLRESLTHYLLEWYGMRLVDGTLSNPNADIIIANESPDMLRYVENNSGIAAEKRTPLIVLCDNVSRFKIYAPQSNSGSLYDFISKPFGPIKLGKALKFCLERSNVHTPASPADGPSPIDRSSSSNTESLALTQHHNPSVPKSPVSEGCDLQPSVHTAPPDTALTTNFSDATRHQIPKLRLDSLPTQIPQVTELLSMASIAPLPTILSPLTLSHSHHAPTLTHGTKENRDSAGTGEPIPNVLIVEDNPINLMLLATFLKKKKYPFTQAENGLLAVKAVQAKPDNFDIILIDLQMPIMSGIEAIRIIRDLEAENPVTMKRSVIIALTGLAGSDDMKEAYDAGVDLFLTKPVSFKVVDRELENWKRQTEKRYSP